ncbi:hypothetical protein [Parasphingorhabdus sp.]|uniref:hypothetical protein n=1 Tax=Parasphingorhabdus sp. TaxID=2709688 RepID=UPI003D2A3C83
MKNRVTLTLLFLGLQSCSSPQEDSNFLEADEAEFPEFKHSPPTGEGMAIAGSSNKSADSITSTSPIVTVSSRWRGRDRTDMEKLVEESISVMVDARFLEDAKALKSDYPKVWFEKYRGFGNAEDVGEFVLNPKSPNRYIAASVVPFSGWARTGGKEGSIKISLNRSLLKRWRSSDVVMRACAINTMAHEITHTLSRSSKTYLYAFRDTGVGAEARRTPPASYLTGDIALCGYLIREGRIHRADLKSCVKVWYKPKGFQSHKCNDFPGDTPIQ